MLCKKYLPAVPCKQLSGIKGDIAGKAIEFHPQSPWHLPSMA